jgi:hypothetical protein
LKDFGLKLIDISAMCSLAAAVQGMDETVNNGAQAIYFAEDVSSFSSWVLKSANYYRPAT